MSKEQRLGPAQPCKPVPCTSGPMDEPLEFAARPANNIEVDPFESGTQLRPVETAVIDDPAPNNGIVHFRQILQGLVAAVMKCPAPDFPANALQRLWTCGRLEAVREDPLLPFQPHRFPGTELEAQEVERNN